MGNKVETTIFTDHSFRSIINLLANKKKRFADVDGIDSLNNRLGFVFIMVMMTNGNLKKQQL